MRTAKILIRLSGCPGRFESSLCAHAILLVLSCAGSIDYLKFCGFTCTPSVFFSFSPILSFDFVCAIATALVFGQLLGLTHFQVYITFVRLLRCFVRILSCLFPYSWVRYCDQIDGEVIAGRFVFRWCVRACWLSVLVCLLIEAILLSIRDIPSLCRRSKKSLGCRPLLPDLAP